MHHPCLLSQNLQILMMTTLIVLKKVRCLDNYGKPLPIIYFLMCNLVLKEIEERREFLSEMEAIGKDKEYRNKIQTEISQVHMVLITNCNMLSMYLFKFFRK